ncbi:DUF6464 family protein [Myxacorys almedinensis]|uniref:Uncharacterized protein n=1 Tax=Myxacorys almedinensis A TaxID=2690445 RepID=A0A8J7YZV2_9CYAN|nr:DUF6464 family protein [Myxacorys almedinensis]NDJ17652.1 hypothetical protein [Myxacorys almedinensis A]
MLEILLILAIGIIPPVLTFFLRHRMELRAQERLQAAMAAAERRQLQRLLSLPHDYQYVEGIGALIGDFSCRHNARSPYIRCAINPTGPCESCHHYESTIQIS